MAAPSKPTRSGRQPIQAQAAMYDGRARGIASATRQNRRPGRSLEVTNHAAATPMTTLAVVTTTARPTDLTRSSSVRWRQTVSANVCHPRSVARTTMYVIGTSTSTDASPPPTSRASGGWARRTRRNTAERPTTDG